MQINKLRLPKAFTLKWIEALVMIKSNISPGYCFALSFVQNKFKYKIELFPELYAIKKLRTTIDPYWFPCKDLEIRIKYLKEVIEKTERNAA